METNKLTAPDIMCWDYFRYKDGTIVRIARVGDISPMDAPIYCHTQLEGYFPCQLADISPIPLTAEILEKIGFLKSLWEIYRLPKTDFSIEHTGGLFILRISNERLCEVKSVSHLQHLLRDFNVDKEIVL